MCRRSEMKRRREPLRKNTPRTISIALLTLYSINQSQEIAHRMQTLDKPSFSPLLFQTSLYARINRIERNTDSPLVESTWAKYGNKFTRTDECMAEQVLRKSNTKPRLSELKRYRCRNTRFRPLVSCFRKQEEEHGPLREGSVYGRAQARASINVLGVGRVCTVAGLYEEQWGGKFVRLQRKEGFARRCDTARRR